MLKADGKNEPGEGEERVGQERGFSLLEVLVAGALLATALLGLAGLAVRGMQDAADARDEMMAALLLRDLESRVALFGGERAWRAPSAAAATEWTLWRDGVARALPSGTGTICPDATPDDGTATAPACDGSGPLVGKVFWRRAVASTAQRRVRVLVP